MHMTELSDQTDEKQKQLLLNQQTMTQRSAGTGWRCRVEEEEEQEEVHRESAQLRLTVGMFRISPPRPREPR